MNGAETGTETGALTEADAAAEAQPHEPVERAGTSCRPTPPPRILHARLQLKSVTFSGGSDIDNDTLGDFKPPHFLVGRKEVVVWRGRFPAQFPYAITRGKKLKAVAVFTVTQQPTGAETVKIDAVAVVHFDCTLKFSGKVDVTPSSTMVSTELMVSDVPLPNAIHRVEPLTINWFQTPVDKARHPAGSSANTLYLTLNTPTTTPLYWTLLEVSCVAASGKTTVDDLRSASYGALETRSIRRKRDGHPLTYWNPRTTTAWSIQRLLAAADGSGQCGSWAEFLVAMWKSHGDDGGHKVVIARSIDKFKAQTGDTLFLVKKWTFVEPLYRADARTFHYRYGVNCKEGKPTPGQTSRNPWPEFYNHFIVIADTKYYDPSYGSPIFRNKLKWENASIDGLHRGEYCGYRKSLLDESDQLLEFEDLETGKRL